VITFSFSRLSHLKKVTLGVLHVVNRVRPGKRAVVGLGGDKLVLAYVFLASKGVDFYVVVSRKSRGLEAGKKSNLPKDRIFGTGDLAST